MTVDNTMNGGEKDVEDADTTSNGAANPITTQLMRIYQAAVNNPEKMIMKGRQDMIRKVSSRTGILHFRYAEVKMKGKEKRY